MTNNLLIKYDFLSEIPHPTGKKFLIVFKAAQLKEYLKIFGNIPLNANLRYPKKNFVTKGIVHDIQSGVLKALPDSIHVYVNSLTKTKDNNVLLDFGGALHKGKQVFGFLNGGHRLLSFSEAFARKIPADDIDIKLEVYQDFDHKEIEEIAIALNKSKQVKVSSIINHGGGYDWLKTELTGLAVRYQENEPGTPDDPFCSVERVIWLLNLVNMEYHTKADKILKHHPLPLGNTSRAMSRDASEVQPRRYACMAADLVRLQSMIALEWDRRSRGTRSTTIRFIQFPRNPAKNTQLPTGETLSCKLPSRGFIAPILSAYRALMKGGIDDDPPAWLYARQFKQIERISHTMINDMVDYYIKVLKHKDSQHKTLAMIATEKGLWDQMHNIAEKHRSILLDTPLYDLKKA